MSRGYWIGHVDISNPERYQDYVRANAVAFARYGARFLVRGGKSETVEGGTRSRHVVIEFPSYDDALACYRSPEYAEARSQRLNAAEADVVVIEGYDGPQPSSQ